MFRTKRANTNNKPIKLSIAEPLKEKIANKVVRSIVLLLCSFALSSCNFGKSSGSVAREKATDEPLQKNSTDIKILPASGRSFKSSEPITISFETSSAYDSAVLVLSKNRIPLEKGNPSVTLKNSDLKLGKMSFEIILYKNGEQYKKSSLINISPQEPAIKKVKVINTLPHSKNNFTQGLTLENGKVYESSGGYGKSFLEVYELPSMKSIQKVALEGSLFAEGSTIVADELFVLSWRENRCLVFDKNTLQKTKEFRYSTEGWGLTTDSKWLYLSDGTHNIYKIDPQTFKFVDKIVVRNHNGPVNYLNELEWIEGYLYANVFTEDYILKIDPQTGAVLELYWAKNIYDNSNNDPLEDVLNGIMYDQSTKKIYITGKSWSKLFEVTLQ